MIVFSQEIRSMNNKYTVDCDAIQQKMKDHRISQNSLATFFCTSSNTVRNKLQGKSKFTITEVQILCSLLCLTDDEVKNIFFGKM